MLFHPKFGKFDDKNREIMLASFFCLGVYIYIYRDNLPFGEGSLVSDGLPALICTGVLLDEEGLSLYTRDNYYLLNFIQTSELSGLPNRVCKIINLNYTQPNLMDLSKYANTC